MNKIIYLDYAASTPVIAAVAEKMHTHLTDPNFVANPTSLHVYGQKAKEAIEVARAQVAALIAATPEEIIWTSGATEAINLALKGGASLYKRKGKHIVTMQTEHKAVLDACQHLEKQGFNVSYLKPESNGLINLATFSAALRPDTILVSIMQVNNETGVIQNIPELAEITASHNILLHVDAAQSIGKVELNLNKTPVDLVSMCAHKAYGPKGIGALYLRKKPRVRVEPLIHGGGQEQGMRSGTLATHQIVGMGEAFAIAKERMQADNSHILALRTAFLQGLRPIQRLSINTPFEYAVPHILNLRFNGMVATAILERLPIAVSTGSACLNQGESHVLRAMGLNDEEIKASIRFSFGRMTQIEEVKQAAKLLCEVLC